MFCWDQKAQKRIAIKFSNDSKSDSKTRTNLSFTTSFGIICLRLDFKEPFTAEAKLLAQDSASVSDFTFRDEVH